MGTIQRTKDDLGEGVSISGAMIETVNLDQSIGAVSGPLRVNCAGITRINSMGIKLWLDYFNRLGGAGVKLTFVECSDAVVQQLNMVSNFLCGGRLESFFVPFRCGSCDAESRGLVNVDAVLKQKLRIPPHPCDSCEGGIAEFDDLPEELLRFLSREGKR